MRGAEEAGGGRATLPPALQLFLVDRVSELVDRLGRITGNVFDRELEMLRPEPSARTGGELRVMNDEVHLRVVEERVFVQVGGAEGEPGVVDDPDLCVDVDRIGMQAGASVKGA